MIKADYYCATVFYWDTNEHVLGLFYSYAEAVEFILDNCSDEQFENTSTERHIAFHWFNTISENLKK
jgi:hypothetical protein